MGRVPAESISQSLIFLFRFSKKEFESPCPFNLCPCPPLLTSLSVASTAKSITGGGRVIDTAKDKAKNYEFHGTSFSTFL